MFENFIGDCIIMMENVYICRFFIFSWNRNNVDWGENVGGVVSVALTGGLLGVEGIALGGCPI